MLTRAEHDRACKRAWAMIEASGLALAPEDRGRLVAADFGLSRLGEEGAQILTFFATERISAKIIVLFPGQCLPEHRHPPVPLGEGRVPDPGKEEILRVQAGRLLLGLEGGGSGALSGAARLEASDDAAPLPAPIRDKPGAYRCRRVLELVPGEQVRLEPGSWHWLAGGPEGCLVFSFSTCVRDVLDEFSDSAVARSTVIEED